jgi:extradiol dioxygenase family protein
MEPILHLSIPVRDLESARAFYVDALGCEPGQNIGESAVDVWFYGLQLTLQERPDEVPPDDAPGVRHFGVTLDRAALDALLARLDAYDVRWISRVERGLVRDKIGAKIADPSGNVIELKSYDDPRTALGAPTHTGARESSR